MIFIVHIRYFNSNVVILLYIVIVISVLFLVWDFNYRILLIVVVENVFVMKSL